MEGPHADSTPDRSPSQTLRLVLMRHAKSDHGDPRWSDFERPLNDRGRRDSPMMADYLAEIDWIPDLVLSSSSARTRETIELMKSQWRGSSQRSDSTDSALTIQYSDALYLASPETIVSVIRKHHADDQARVKYRCVMVLAHNPGISGVVSCFAHQPIEMPTAAVACMASEFPFRGLQLTDRLCLEHFIRPKSLL